MALSARTQYIIKEVLTDARISGPELIAAIASPATLSIRTVRRIKIAMGDVTAANEFINAVQTAGYQALSARTKDYLIVAFHDAAAAAEIIAAI
jgi:hypothetical protein